MAEADVRFAWSAVAHGVGQWAGGAAKEGISVVTVNQNVFAAQSPHDVLAEESGDPLGAVIPKHDPPVLIDQVNSGREVFQDGAVDVWIFEFRHRPPFDKMNRLNSEEA